MPSSQNFPGSNGTSGGTVVSMTGTDSFRSNGADTGGAAAFANLQTGHVIGDRFEIRKQIGVGGMGAVYRAYDRNQSDDIAIKVMLPELASNESAKQRFISEARISIKLSHQNIVNTFDVLSDGSFLFITMELLEGRSLRQDIETRKRVRRPYTEAEALDIVRPLCDALEYAHDYTIHRDIKPENVWLTNKDKVKLMDFGIARILNGSQISKSTAVLGTAYYMAPEQLSASKEVDHRADQYAVGVLLYELLTGQVPTGRSKAVRQLRPDVSAAVSDAIDRALEPDPEDRFPDVHHFSEALGGAKQAASQKSRKSTTAGSGQSGLTAWINEHRVLVSVGTVLWGGVLATAYLVRQDSIKQNHVRWEKWQIEMNAAFDQTEKLKGDPDARAKAWKQYLAAYAKDNPFSLEDEKLRAQADTNRTEAEEEKKSQLALAKQQKDAAQRHKAQTQVVQQAAYAVPPVQQPVRQPQVAQAQVVQPQRTAEQEAGLMILNRMLR